MTTGHPKLPRAPLQATHPGQIKKTGRRILIVSKNGMLTWHVSLQAAFASLGIETRFSSVNSSGVPDLLERLRHGRKHLLSRSIIRRLCITAGHFQPDLILTLVSVFPNHILPELDARMSRRPLLASWPSDCPLPDHAQQFVKHDAFFSFDSALNAPARCFVHNEKQVIPLPLAFDPHQYHPLPETPVTHDVLFAGSCSAARMKFVAQLRTNGIPVTAYGFEWPKGVLKLPQSRQSHAQINRHLNASRIVLNHQQQPNTVNGLNLRAFEATGAEAFLLTPNVADLPACFEPNREIIAYRSMDELADLIQRGLKDAAWARRIAEAGHRRALAEHTFDHRARTIARHFGWL